MEQYLCLPLLTRNSVPSGKFLPLDTIAAWSSATFGTSPDLPINHNVPNRSTDWLAQTSSDATSGCLRSRPLDASRSAEYRYFHGSRLPPSSFAERIFIMSAPPERGSSLHLSSNPSSSISADDLARLYRPSPVEEAYSHVDHVREAVEAAASGLDRVPLGHELNYYVNRKRELRVNRLKQGKTKFKPGTKQAVAQKGREKLLELEKEKRERREREEQWAQQEQQEQRRKAREEWQEEMRKAREERQQMDRELFGSESDSDDDGGNNKTNGADADADAMMRDAEPVGKANESNDRVQGAKGADATDKNHSGLSQDKPERPRSFIAREVERMQADAEANLARIEGNEKADKFNKMHKKADFASISKSIERRVKSGTIVKPPKTKKKLFRRWDSPPDTDLTDETTPIETGQKETPPTYPIENQVTGQQAVEQEPVHNQTVRKRLVRRKHITGTDHLFLPRSPTRKRMTARQVITIHQDEAAERSQSQSPLFFENGHGPKVSGSPANDPTNLSAAENKQAKLLGEAGVDEDGDDDDVVVTRSRRRRLGPNGTVNTNSGNKSTRRAELDAEDQGGVRGWLALPTP